MDQEEKYVFTSYTTIISLQFPTLVCPKYHTPIIVVSEDYNDVMKSKLLSSRALCQDHKDTSGQSLRVIEDFLRFYY